MDKIEVAAIVFLEKLALQKARLMPCEPFDEQSKRGEKDLLAHTRA